MRFLLSFVAVINCINLALTQPVKPKLVVGIIVDQMRQGYLLRFDEKFGENGFHRLQRGFTAYNGHYNYVPTSTGPGHSSVYTGTSPRSHGIIGNNWYDKNTGNSIYCVEDNNVHVVGGDPSAGNVSPRNLVSSTITDELKLSTNLRGKVVGIAIKDRGSVLPAGHLPDGAYWYDGETGNFVTSSFYMEQLPKWVNDFNSKKLVSKYMNSVWETILPIEQYVESLPDNNPYEKVVKGKDTPTFPYDLKKLSKDNSPLDLIRSTPFGNTLTLDFALAAMEGEQLGKDDITDFLAISFSSTDYIGHAFGPTSVEIEDTYIRLDKEIERLLQTLDDKVWKDNYIVFLTADHAAVINSQFLVDHNLPGGYIDGSDVSKNLNEKLKEVYGDENWILNISNNQVFINKELVAEKNIDLAQMKNVIKQELMKFDAMAEAYSAEELTSLAYTNNMLLNGYNPQRSGDVIYQYRPGYLSGKPRDKGTSHGTQYNYDTNVPILFYGAGIKTRACYRRISITDIAPTLSMLLGISLPAATNGEPIVEIFE